MTITLRNHRQTPFPTDANPASINRERMAVRFCGAHTCPTPTAPLSRYNSDAVCGVCSNRRAEQITVDALKHSTKLLPCSVCGEYLPDEEFSPQPRRPLRRGRCSACRACENARRTAARVVARVS